MADKKAYLIDATAFCYRAFYALSSLSTSYGQPTNAVFGFINILNKIIKEHRPDYLAACFDVSRDTFRSRKFAAYKIQRPPMPEGLSSQIPIIKEVISAYRIPIFEKQGFEADDIIATLAKKCVKEGLEVVVVSSDKDILQLVSEHILVFNPYKEEGIFYDKETINERFGVEPARIADIISLMGDASDNLPGVEGIGAKTAVKLVKEFGSLDNLLEHTERIKPDKLAGLIAQNAQKIRLNQELVELNAEMDLAFDLDTLAVREADYRSLTTIFRRLEFKRLLKTISCRQGAVSCAADQELPAAGPAEIKKIISSGGEIFISAGGGGIVFSAGGEIFSARERTKELKDMLSSAQVKKCGHDLKAMKVGLAREGITLEGLFFDTMLAAYLLNPSKPGYALADIAPEYLGETGQEQAAGQAAQIAFVMRLKPVLEKELKEKGLFDLFSNLEIPLAAVLAQMEESGLKIDLGLLAELSQKIEKRLVKLASDIYGYSGSQFNINSTKQLAEVLFGRLGLPVVKKTKTGPSTDEEVLRFLAAKHALPALILEYRQLAKLKNTYIDALPLLVDKNDAKLHTCFNQAGTETGRLSSSNPNLQNIPIKTDVGRDIRRAVIPSFKGGLFLCCDYSQIELRILAHLSQDETLINAFRAGLDIHQATAALIYGVAEDKVDGTMRETAKRVNFGIIYGQGAFSLSKDLGITQSEAQDFIDAYFLRYPRVKEYIDAQIKKAQEQGFVTTLLGRRRYIPEINNKNQAIRQFAQRQAVNTPLQGSASDLIKAAMVKIYRQIKEVHLAAAMVLQVHDELVFDLPQEELGVLEGIARQTMENVLRLDVPVKVVLKKGRNWLELEEL